MRCDESDGGEMSWECHRCGAVLSDTTPSCWCPPPTSTGTSTEMEPPRPICEACGEIEVLLGDWCEQCGIIESRRGQKALELLQEFDTWGAVEHDDITDHETMLTALKFIGDFIPKARALLKDGER